MRRDRITLTRREALKLAGSSGIAGLTGGFCKTTPAQPANLLPLRTAGLEHYSITVPDPEAAAKFYAPIFDMQLFKERDPPPRYYVTLGVAYIAFGARTNAAPFIDHISASVMDFDMESLRASLAAAGAPMGAGRFAMIDDPDKLRFQLVDAPAGLADTVVPAYRVANGAAALQAIGLDHIVLHVSDIEKSAEHYRKLLGPEVARSSNPARVWFQASTTRLGLEQVSAAPQIHHVCVRIAGYDRRVASERLRALGVEIVSDSDEGLLRFRDPWGIVTELTGE
jgi:catechol 2,3-dioxygenase-like lactoylglutathione lyase family enzyme